MSGNLDNDSAWVPRLAALLTAVVGAVNVASALTPDLSRRGLLLAQVEPIASITLFHALALPGGAALLVVAPYLLRRRRRALEVTIATLLVLGIVNLLKGLDVEESLLGWLVAGGLYSRRAAFDVAHEPITLRSGLWRVPLVTVVALAVVVVGDWVSSGRPRLDTLLDETGALARFRGGPQRFEIHSAGALDQVVHFAWVPLGVHLVEIGALLAIAYLIFKPLAVPRSPASAAARRRAIEVVRAHGRDTLAFFKLRTDKQLYFDEARTAFVGYRIEAGSLLLSGDPVGPPDAFPQLLRSVRRFARSRGLRMAALGASPELVPVYERLGLRSLYLGDEAIIELRRFSLEGRPIRKVRQSVNRLRKAGFSCELCSLRDLDPAAMSELERVMALGRIGRSERGFAMGMDGIHGVLEDDTVLVLARDAGARIRAMLHFVPCYGRAAVSLSLMRRDPGTPNGLMEFLVVGAIEALRAQGVEEMSLNFAALGRYLRAPEGPLERALGRVATVLNRYFQVESLYRFNVKFAPRWQPRYLIYEGALGLPRAALASIWAEGQLPKPSLPRLVTHARRGQQTINPATR